MKNTLYAAAILAVLAIAAAGLALADLFHAAERATNALIPAVDAAIEREGRLTRETADKRAEAIQRALDWQLSAMRRDAVRQIAETRGAAVGEIAAARQDITGQLSRANDSLSQLAALRQDVAPTIARVNEASGVLLRRDALPAQILGLTAAGKVTLGETALTMREVRRAAPGMVEAAGRTAGSMEKAASNVERMTRPDSLGIKVLKAFSPALGGAVLGALK